MITSGSNTCSYCEKKYTWILRGSDKTGDGNNKPSEYVEGETYAKCINETDKTIVFSCHCPYCEQTDRFELKKAL